MPISPAGIDLLHHFESCRLEAYPDPKTGGAPWTIGWGHAGPDVKPGMRWTQKQADEAFMEDLEHFQNLVEGRVTVPLTQGQYDAMVSILYNVGPGSPKKDGIIRLKNGKPSTLLRKLNAGDYKGAEAEFHKWVSPGSSVEKGLRRRRKAEAELFARGSWSR